MPSARNRREVLFISSMPASRSNAIGMQILQLSESFPSSWSHCYWDVSMGKSAVQSSFCLNSFIPYYWPFAVGRGFLYRQIERFGMGWWRGDKLLERRKPQLRKMLSSAEFVYIHPLRNSEATRCREIIEILERPFSIHIWDINDEDLNSDYQWLFSHAERIFCVSESMVSECRHHAAKVSLMPFIRHRSKFRATNPSDKLVIGLIGFLESYQEGLHLLGAAIQGLCRQFRQVRIKYIGPPGQLKLIPGSLKVLTDYAGFLDDEERDEVLSHCNVGYLPGPLLSPTSDLRSRHSIPSRSADYMAAGLPVIASVNPLSATSRFFSPLRDRGFFEVNSPEDICNVAGRLQQKELWEQSARTCVDFFNRHFDRDVALDQLRKNTFSSAS